MELNEYTTYELVKELRKRDGIKSIEVKPDNNYFISVDDDFEDIEIDEVGPITILIC